MLKGAPENVIEYIGRYSFRVAISNERIKDISNGKVTFEYKDYKDERKLKEFVCPCCGFKSFSYNFSYCNQYRLCEYFKSHIYNIYGVRGIVLKKYILYSTYY